MTLCFTERAKHSFFALPKPFPFSFLPIFMFSHEWNMFKPVILCTSYDYCWVWWSVRDRTDSRQSHHKSARHHQKHIIDSSVGHNRQHCSIPNKCVDMSPSFVIPDFTITCMSRSCSSSLAMSCVRLQYSSHMSFSFWVSFPREYWQSPHSAKSYNM